VAAAVVAAGAVVAVLSPQAAKPIVNKTANITNTAVLLVLHLILIDFLLSF
jgi:hypothetical protein